jgi:tRNA-dihydrouridine synthase
MAECNGDLVLEKAAKLYKGEALAPMVRASTIPLRILALRYGADFCYTEELVDRSLGSCTRVVNDGLGTIDYFKDISSLSAKSKRKLDNGQHLVLRIDPVVESGRLVCQIGSGEPEFALAAARVVHRDVQGIDLNMGCPKVRVFSFRAADLVLLMVVVVRCGFPSHRSLLTLFVYCIVP